MTGADDPVGIAGPVEHESLVDDRSVCPGLNDLAEEGCVLGSFGGRSFITRTDQVSVHQIA